MFQTAQWLALSLPKEVEITAIRAQGSGGQNVNKVSSAVHLRFDVRASSLPDEAKARLLAHRDQRLTREGVLIIKAQSTRSQELNRQDALLRLSTLIAQIMQPIRPRRPTKPGRAAQQRRLDNKQHRAQVKANRTKLSDET